MAITKFIFFLSYYNISCSTSRKIYFFWNFIFFTTSLILKKDQMNFFLNIDCLPNKNRFFTSSFF